MSEHAGSDASDAGERQGFWDSFYARRYTAEQQGLQGALFREVYDDYCGQSSWITTADYDRFHRWLALTPDACVLDVACGGGGPTLRLARRAGCAVVGIDNNAPAIARATALAQARGLSDRARFERRDASPPMPLPDGTFDAVVCLDALAHLRDHPRVFAEWARVLRPGGRLLFTNKVLTGPLANAEVAARSPVDFSRFPPPGYHERLIEAAGFALLRREDLTASFAELGRRWCVTRAAHAEALRAVEGEAVFAEQNAYRAVAERLARERRLSHIAYLARKGS